MNPFGQLCIRILFPLFRRKPFRGLGRLRPFLPVPAEGTAVVSFDGFSLRLDLREEHQRDMLVGLYDRMELRLMRRALADGGDAVDIGAHIGFYAVAAALSVGPRGGRVLAFEPNPTAREQLQANCALNHCDNVEVLPLAVGSGPGRAVLHVPLSADPSWSSLAPRGFDEGEPIEVTVIDADSAVRDRGLDPSFVKVDVEGFELDVLDGMEHVLSVQRPVVLCEVSAETATSASARLGALGYETYRVGPRRLTAGPGELSGIFNLLFVPPARVSEFDVRGR